MLESRLDNTLYRLGFAPTRRGARQLVVHKHIMVNNRSVNIPSYGLKEGDIIKQIDGISINKFSDLKGYLNTKRPNDVVSIKLKVGAEEKTVSVKLNKNERVQFYLIGILKNLNSNELKKYNINSGVKISEFNNNYKKYWTDYGINEGNIIKSINGEKITSILDVERILNSRYYNEPISIEIIENKNITERFNFR